jgi:aldehyde:ferredoxin oxidoreductase
VNLSTGKISKESINENLIKRYLGGRGLATKYISMEIDPKVDPLSPENKLIFANGLLTGTSAPTGGRYMVVTKGPLTGTIASSNSGGFFGAELSHAGYMLLIVEGEAKSPVYISIKDDEVKINNASEMWGMNTHQITDTILEKFGETKARVACIGPAGEK